MVVTVSGQAHASDAAVILPVRPSVRATGLRQVKFPSGAEGPRLDVYAVKRGREKVHYDQLEQRRVFAGVVVAPGESETGAELFDLGEIGDDVLGWLVELHAASGKWHWRDQVFVPVPAASVKAVEEVGDERQRDGDGS